jgi:nucleotide-binding universal stress UspA family protein
VKRVKTDLPGWTVRSETSCDAPAWAVLQLAEKFKPSLIVLGSHGHSLIGGRLILGSVSQRVLHEAGCSVRVARCWNEERKGPVRLLIGFNGSQDSEAAVNAVASRVWPERSEARLITARLELSSEARDVATARLQAVGLSTSAFSRDGDPVHVLIREAEEWEADSIFVGTRDVHGFQHLLHGSVSAAVAAHARCSVEVARASRRAA